MTELAAEGAFDEYPPEIRKAIYTTTAVESLNSVIRAATKRSKVFPSDDSARKVIYLAIAQAFKKMDDVDSKLKNGVESIDD